MAVGPRLPVTWLGRTAECPQVAQARARRLGPSAFAAARERKPRAAVRMPVLVAIYPPQATFPYSLRAAPGERPAPWTVSRLVRAELDSRRILAPEEARAPASSPEGWQAARSRAGWRLTQEKSPVRSEAAT